MAIVSIGGKKYETSKKADGTTSIKKVGGQTSNSANKPSGTSGGGNYTIGSDRGKSIANNMSIGTSWTNDVDGSVWTKNNDGSISVNHNGVVTSNAYQMSDLGTLGRQQVAAGLPANVVQGTRNARVNKALTTDGLRDFAYDDTTRYLTDYIQKQSATENQNTAQQNYMNWLNDYLQKNAKPTEPTRDPRIDAQLNKILNRDDFSYNASDDPLYQQYAEMYRREGDRAMQETLAEAAASAGGMNTYAITAAQQANNYYNSQLNDRIPELYQLAYDMYLAEKESEIQDLGLLQNMDETQYNRYRNTMNDWYNDKNFAYGAYQDAVAQGNWQTNRDDNLRLNEQQFAYDDYWRNKEWDYNDAWRNKEWDYNEQWDNKKWSKQEQEDAEAEVKYWMEKGYMPSDELIAKSGIDKSLVEKRVAEIQAERAGTGYSGGGSSGGGGSRRYVTNDDDKTPAVTDDKAFVKDVVNLGLPRVVDKTVIVQLADAGAIYDDENDIAQWAPGWNKNNYERKLKLGY